MTNTSIFKKKKYLLTFPATLTTDPVIYNLIKRFDLKINILKAEITSGEAGKLLAEFNGEGKKINEALSYLNETGIEYASIEKKITYKEEDCVHCGSCTAVCFAGALTLNKDDKKIKCDYDNCVGCELCVTACPLFLLQIDLGA